MNLTSRPLRILLVDDSGIVRCAVRTFLQTYTDLEIVGEAENGKLAIQMARELVPLVVVMDIQMPVMDGIEATRQIVAENPNLRVIAYSAAARQSSIVKEILDAGAVGFVNKGGEVAELVQSIRMLARDDYANH